LTPIPVGSQLFELIRENLAWLDKYLGPVERAAQ
jgi:hypothetical protein